MAVATTPAYGLIAALGDQGEKAASAVPLLLKVFDQADGLTKLAIVETLGRIGPSAKAALPLLTRLSASAKAELAGSAKGDGQGSGANPKLANAELGRAADVAITAIRRKQ